MTTLRLAIDAREMRTGAAEARRNLDDIKRAASDAASSLGSGGSGGGPGLEPALRRTAEGFRGMRDAIQIGGGLVQTAGNVGALVTQVGNLGTGMGAVAGATNVASRGLLEFVRIAQDIQQLRLAERLSGVAQQSSLIGLLWKANPLLLAVSGLSLAASAMSLFAGSTNEATESIKKQVTEFDQLKLRMQEVAGLQAISARAGVPFEDPRLSARSTIESVRAIRTSDRRSYGVSEIAQLFGMTEMEFRRFIGEEGLIGEPGVDALGAIRPGQFRYSLRQLTGEQAAGLGERLAGERYREAEERARLSAFQRAAPQPTVGVAGPGAQYGPSAGEAEMARYLDSVNKETQALAMNEQQRQQFIAVVQAENFARQQGIELTDSAKQQIRDEIALQQQLVELRQLGEQVGASLGNAFFSFINGANSARQAVALLIQDLARLAQQQVVQGLSGALGGIFANGFGATPSQIASGGAAGAMAGAQGGGA